MGLVMNPRPLDITATGLLRRLRPLDIIAVGV